MSDECSCHSIYRCIYIGHKNLFLYLSADWRLAPMPQRVRRDALVQARRLGSQANRVLEAGIQHMVSPLETRVRIPHGLARREEPLPLPGRARTGIFALQRFGQPDPGQSGRPVRLVEPAHPVPVGAEVRILDSYKTVTTGQWIGVGMRD